MLWEATMVNRVYKTNEFCRLKPRMHNDRVIYAVNDGLKFANNFQKLQKDDTFASEMEVLTYFGIEYAELGDIPKYYHQQRENDKEYYQFSELHFCYQILKLAVLKGSL